MTNDLAWAIFSYKINVLKSLLHFIVPKVKPVVSLQCYDLVSPSQFLENSYKVLCNGILLHPNMSNTSGRSGESEFTMLMSSVDMCLALVHVILLELSSSLTSWAGLRVGVEPRLSGFLLPEHPAPFRVPTEMLKGSSTPPKWFAPCTGQNSGPHRAESLIFCVKSKFLVPRWIFLI